MIPGERSPDLPEHNHNRRQIACADVVRLVFINRGETPIQSAIRVCYTL
jgi:hypothetical protein